MKNLKKIIVTVFTMTLLMSVTAFAATADDLKAKLTAAGVPAEYNTQIAEYLTANPLSDSQANGVIANIDTLNTKLAGRTTKAEFTKEEKAEIVGLVQKTASSVGLTVTSDGTTIFILDGSGNSVGKTTIADFEKNASKFNAQAFKDAVNIAKTLEANQATKMKETATNNGNVLVLGLGILALAGSVFVVSKKVQA